MDMKKPHIDLLVVEDDENVRFILTRVFLRFPSLAVVYAPTGRQAIETLDVVSPRAVILDVGLPDISGVEVLKRMRSLSEADQLHIVVFTGLEDESTKNECMRLGADEYFVKPADIKKLMRAVRRLVLCVVRSICRANIECLENGALGECLYRASEDPNFECPAE